MGTWGDDLVEKIFDVKQKGWNLNLQCPSLVFVVMINVNPPNNSGNEGVFFLTAYSPSSQEIKAGTHSIKEHGIRK